MSNIKKLMMSGASGGASFLVKYWDADTTTNVQSPMTVVDPDDNIYIVDSNAKYTASNLSINIIKLDKDGNEQYNKNHYYTGYGNEAYCVSDPVYQNGYIGVPMRANNRGNAFMLIDASDGSVAHAGYPSSAGSGITMTAAPDSDKILMAYEGSANLFQGFYHTDTTNGVGTIDMHKITYSNLGDGSYQYPSGYPTIFTDGASSGANYYTSYLYFAGGSTASYYIYPWSNSAKSASGTTCYYFGGLGYISRYNMEQLTNGSWTFSADTGKIGTIDSSFSTVRYASLSGSTQGPVEYEPNKVIYPRNSGRVSAVDLSTNGSWALEWDKRSKSRLASAPSDGQIIWLGGKMLSDGRVVITGKEGSNPYYNLYVWVTDPVNPATGPVNPTDNNNEYWEMAEDTITLGSESTVSISSNTSGAGSNNNSVNNITSNWTTTDGPGTYEYHSL